MPVDLHPYKATLFLATWLAAALPSPAQISVCPLQNLRCGASVQGTLTASDCDIGTGYVTDLFQFDGMAGQTVTIDATSPELDIQLFLFAPPNPDQPPATQDDDGGPGNDPRIVYGLTVSGKWTIAVANSLADQLGSYTLSLDCAGGTGGSPPEPPSRLWATVLSDSEIRLDWRDGSNNEDEFQIQAKMGGTGFQTLASAPADSTSWLLPNLYPQTTYTFRVRARNVAGSSTFSNSAKAETDHEKRDPFAPCVPSPTDMCLQGNRFRLEVDWRNINGEIGVGKVVADPSSDTSGLFSFYNPDNWEMLLKVLDGCNFNDHYWVFVAAATDVEWEITVTDTQTGDFQTWSNPYGQPSPAITDTEAFATCP